MKKYISLFLVLAMALSFSPTLAQDDRSENDTRPKDRLMEIRDTHKDRVQEIRTDALEKRNEMRENVTDRRYRMRGLILRAFNLRIAHLENISARIELRMEKLEERGVDTTEAQGFLVMANNSLEDAKASLAEATTVWEEGQDLATLRELLGNVKSSLRETHGYLRDTVRSLRASMASENQGDDENEEKEDEE